MADDSIPVPAAAPQPRHCAMCRAPFTTPDRPAAIRLPRFCSRACGAAFKARRRIRNPVRCVCEGCGAEFHIVPSQAALGNGKFCTHACRARANVEKNNETRWAKVPPARLRFWESLDKSPEPDGCWLWSARPHDQKYGTLSVGNRTVLAHRHAYELENGPIADAQWVLHRCDTPACCRPSHLFLGKPKDNSDDMVSKDRSSFGVRHHASKLTDDAVRDIRASGETGVALAERYGVTPVAISHVRRGRVWRRVK